ncbi:MFS transporter [Thiohalomonas denitrificans]|uniref:Predicted arabinose efflux permease, MFS family n=1 Tax=Thiohalomonas denitrificans TaxID=415747 RepID=A0A1G5QKK9_9GAMM|nr:MFS transporter [Thiohalomonas denitrificans]SCZ62090.1 Predicted arabinose efflux permease, MFS family [Thiohalomonas denitrificans]
MDPEQRPPHRHHPGFDIGANRTVFALAMARLGDALGNSMLFVVIPLYVASLPAPWLPFPDALQAGILISIYGLITTAVQPLAGAWVDWSDRRKPFILGGLLLAGAAIASFVFARQFGELLFLRVFQGIGLALTIPAGMALLAANTEKSTRGGSMGIYTTARLIGFGLGPLVGGALHDTLGFNAVFYTAAGFIAIATLLVQLWIKDGPSRGTTEVRRTFRVFDRTLLSPGILGAALAVFAMASAFSVMTPLEQEFNERLEQGAFAFGAAFSVLILTRLLLQVPFGRLSDRFGRKTVIISGLMIMAPATALIGEVQTTTQLLGLRAIQGIGSAGIAAPAFALAADVSTDGNTGRQMALATMGFGLGIATGPMLAGVLAIISFRLPFLVAAALLLGAAWTLYRYVPETLESGTGDRLP